MTRFADELAAPVAFAVCRNRDCLAVRFVRTIEVRPDRTP